MKQSVKGLIFDFGGTIDTNGYHWSEVIRQEYERHNVRVAEEDLREAFRNAEISLGHNNIILPEDTYLKTLEKKIAIHLKYLNIIDLSLSKRIAADCYAHVVTTVEAAKPVLEALRSDYQMVIVSNFYGNLATIIAELGLTRYFRRVFDSTVCGVRKPSVQWFLDVAAYMGLQPEEITVIGDSYKNDIAPAIEAGMESIWLRVKSWNKEDIEIQHPHIITSLASLLTTG